MFVQDPDLQDLTMGFDNFEGVNPEPSLSHPTVIPDDDASGLEAGRKLDQDASQVGNQGIPVVENDKIEEIVVDNDETEPDRDQNSWPLKKCSTRPTD
jgi:hypothetical protein